MEGKTAKLERLNEDDSLLDDDTDDLGYGIPDFEYEMLLRKKYDPLVDVIIVRKGREGIWEVVDKILKFMQVNFPEEIREVIEDVKKDREMSYNKWASNKDKTLRKLGSIPIRLENLLFRAYMGEWPMPNKEFRRKFFQRYPVFAVSQPSTKGSGLSRFDSKK